MNSNKISLKKLIYKNLIATTFLAILIIMFIVSSLYFSNLRKFSDSVSKTVVEFEIKKNKTIIEKEAELTALKLIEVEDLANVMKNTTEEYFNDFYSLYSTASEISLHEIKTNPNLYNNFIRKGMPSFNLHENGSTYKSTKVGGSLYYSADTQLGKKEFFKAISSEILDSIHMSMVDNNSLITQAYLNTWDNMNRIYPYIDNISKQYGRSVIMKNHNFYYKADSEHNPAKKTVWTEAYLDPAGQGWMISCIFPIYHNGFLEGVSGLDVTIDSFITNLFDERLPDHTSLFVLSKNASILAMDEATEKLFQLKELKSHDYVNDIDLTMLKPNDYILTKNTSDKLKKSISHMFSENISFDKIKYNNKSYLIRQVSIPKLDWKLFTITDEEKLLEPVQTQKKIYDKLMLKGLIIVCLLYLVLVIILFYNTRKIVSLVIKPIKLLSKQTKDIGKNIANNLVSSEISEIDILSHNFKQMADELQERTNKIVSIEVEKQKKIKEAEIYYKNSITDSLTGLYNRLKIDEILDYEIKQSKRYKHDLSLIFADIDNFKIINDTFGHDKGDQVLIEISKILKNNLRDTDSIGRWGGEEFVIICKKTDKNRAFIIAEKIRKIIEQHDFTTGNKQTASFGIAEYIDGDDRRNLTTKADSAMYKAKQLSKNVVIIYSE